VKTDYHLDRSKIDGWLDRVGLSFSQASKVLGLSDLRTMARRYLSLTTSYHMDLYEQVVLAQAALLEGRLNDAKDILERAIDARLSDASASPAGRLAPYFEDHQTCCGDGPVQIIETGEPSVATRINQRRESK